MRGPFIDWRLIGVGVGVVVMAGVLAVCVDAPRSQADSKEVRATRFILVDDKGKERAILGMEGDSPVLKLLDDKGKDRIILHQGRGGLFLLDRAGRTRVYLLNSELAFHDEISEERAKLGISTMGPEVAISGEKGKKTSASLSITLGRPALFLTDEKGRTRVLNK